MILFRYMQFVLAAAKTPLGKSFSHWIRHLGALGFLPLGLLDSSVIPVPGSMDILTIVLAARDEELWPYYAIMATLGSVVGGCVTYRLARKGGREALEHRFSRGKMEKISRLFDRWGFGAIAIPAILPPPVPMVPFIFAAGATEYPVTKFIAAMTLGRIVRYSVLGFLAARYGRQMRTFIAQNGHPVGLVILGVVALAIAIFVFLRLR